MSAGVPGAVTRAGGAAADRAAGRLADAIRAELPGLAVRRAPDGTVVVTGRGLFAQPLLRWPAGLLR